jgi:cation transport ATPase
MAAIIVSAMSDRLLKEAEFQQGDPNDIDAATLDEIVDRVKATYSAKAEERIQMMEREYQQKVAASEAREREAAERANQVERSAAEAERKRQLALGDRAQRWAKGIACVLRYPVTLLLGFGAVLLLISHPFHPGWIGFAFGIPLVVFVLLEFFGILKHWSEICARVETATKRRFRKWLGGE